MKAVKDVFVRLFVALLLLGTVACSGGDSANNQIEELENRYQELLAQPGSQSQLDSVRITMKELATAYEQRSLTDIPAEDAVNDLYRAAELFSGAQDIGTALNTFDQIMERFPDHKRAADALFQKGFLYNNTIGDTAKARVAYTEFIKKYPDDPLADDAQIEIDRLGIPTEEWLERFINQGDSTQAKASE